VSNKTKKKRVGMCERLRLGGKKGVLKYDGQAKFRLAVRGRSGRKAVLNDELPRREKGKLRMGSIKGSVTARGNGVKGQNNRASHLAEKSIILKKKNVHCSAL